LLVWLYFQLTSLRRISWLNFILLELYLLFTILFYIITNPIIYFIFTCKFTIFCKLFSSYFYKLVFILFLNIVLFIQYHILFIFEILGYWVLIVQYLKWNLGWLLFFNWIGVLIFINPRWELLAFSLMCLVWRIVCFRRSLWNNFLFY